MPPRRRPSRLHRVLSSLVLLVFFLGGVALFAVTSALPANAERTEGGNLPLDPGALTATDLTASNSPLVVSNPRDGRNLAVASRIDAPHPTCSLQLSFDGGGTWIEGLIPVPAAKQIACFAPDAAFAKDGTLFLSFTSFDAVRSHGVVPDAVWLCVSHDGGRTFSAPQHAAGALAFDVHLIADPDNATRLYLTWVQVSSAGPWGFAQTGNPIVVSRSDDGGRTWGAPVRASSPSRMRVIAPTLAAGGGSVYVLYVDLGGDALDYEGAHEGSAGPPDMHRWTLVLARSHDGGATWSETVVDASVMATQRVVVVYPPEPSLVVDPQHSMVYVAYQDRRFGDADVLLWTSSDGGSSFDAPRRVNDTPRGDGTSQYLPRLSVAPNGRLDVLYYDRRGDHSDVLTGVSMQSSFDQGRTFRPHLTLSERTFDPRINGSNGGAVVSLGSRLGLLATDDAALAVWTDTRAGTLLTGKQDLTRQLVAVSQATPWWTVLRWGGAAVAGLALVVVLAMPLRPRRPDRAAAAG